MILALLAIIQSTGGWQVTDKVSQLDGARSYHAILQADGPVANVINEPQKPDIGLDCDKQGLFVGVDWPDFIDKFSYSDTSVSVSWKLDDGPVHRENWTAGDQMVAVMGKKAQGMMAQLATAKRLVISVPDKHGGQEAVFNLDGVAPIVTAIDGLRCG